jgi:hypothetical protein
MSISSSHIIQKTFKDKDGKLAIAGVPNLPLLTWLVTLPLGWIASGSTEKLVSVVGHGALFTWAWLELFQGVNYFRRALGAVVLVYTIWSAVKS